MTFPACGWCGVWECAACGHKASLRNRFSLAPHACSRCGSGEGRMLPVHHRKEAKRADHAASTPTGTPRYPL